MKVSQEGDVLVRRACQSQLRSAHLEVNVMKVMYVVPSEGGA
jgi:hypothetical protein